jgi:hypothetical protein
MSTPYVVSEGLVETLQLLLPVDREVVMVNGVITFEMKLGDLPKETISAYTFPLSSVDLILGLPWLQKVQSAHRLSNFVLRVHPQ